MKKMTFKGLLVAICAVLPLSKVSAQAFTENFDNIGTLAGNGWFTQNNSTPVGLIANWFQGTPTSATPTPGPFDAYNGAGNSYIAANFNFVSGNNTISGWMLTPNRTFRNGDVISFYARSTNSQWSDRMQVRMSTNGASTNVGTGGEGVGDFTTMLLEINPGQVQGVFLNAWTLYTITISGLPAPTSGRIAFRYYVTGGGTGADSDYIGVDNVVYTPYVCPTFTMTPSGALTGGTAGAAYNTTLTQTGSLGAPNFAITAGALPPGLTLSAAGTISGTPTATGTFNFTATVSDASGCSGSSSYSITVVCPANPTTLNGLPALCSNADPYALTQGLPAGGTYSGTGITGSDFDPAVGTQTITYDYTDPYGCAHQTSNTITVNDAPVVTQDPLAAICDNGGIVALTGGSPAGGTYTGTGVTGSDFDPASGSQTITYTYTDANGCTNSTTAGITVNTAPTVTHDAMNAVCADAGMVALTGGAPAGGSYSGTGITGSDFDASSGTQTITYTYTDANNCSNSADFTMTVNDLPVVTQDPIGAVCEDAADVTLSGGLPAGGSYSGTGVTAGVFDPSGGTQTVTYTYTDGNNCANTATTTITVNELPAVTQDPIGAVCEDAADVTLSGGLPTGGSYSGTGVTAGVFDPSSGTQTVTYTYTDGNNCTNTATTTITVNDLPVVTLTLTEPDLCIYDDEITLAGGSPAGGTYSGTAVTAGEFDPATAGLGTHPITYVYTDANGCASSSDDNILVGECLGVDEADLTELTAYPNPANGVFHIQLPANSELKGTVVTDVQGKIVRTNATAEANGILLDLTGFENGLYFLNGELNGRPVSVRLMKQ